MSSMNVSLSYLRSIASWKPFTTNDATPTLMNVWFSVADNKLTAVVTDRYRIVMRTDVIGGEFVNSVDYLGDGIQVPIASIIQYVTATKAEKYARGLSVDIDADVDAREVVISGVGTTVRSVYYNGSFPKVVGLVDVWEVNPNPVNPVGFDVVRVGDFAKLISPSTGKKYSTSWKFEQGKGSMPDKSGSYRLTNAEDENVIALIQPVAVK